MKVVHTVLNPNKKLNFYFDDFDLRELFWLVYPGKKNFQGKNASTVVGAKMAPHF